MKPFPHHYAASASANPDDPVILESDRLPGLAIAPPEEFDGPGDQWSPETLFVGAIVGCFMLTFRSVARAADLEWLDLRCEVDGTMDRADRVSRFTKVRVRVRLIVPTQSRESMARRLLERTQRLCLIPNSVSADVTFELAVDVADSIG